MVIFWGVLAVVLAALLLYSWSMDRQAARAGKVLVPVKHGRRTRFVAVDREEAARRRVEDLAAEQERARQARRAAASGAPGSGRGGLLGLLGLTRQRGR